MSHIKSISIALLVAVMALSVAAIQISPVLADDNPVPPVSPEESWQPPDKSGQSVEPPVPVEQYSQTTAGLQIAQPSPFIPGSASSIVNAYLVDRYGRTVTNLYGNEAIYLVVSVNGPGYFYLWEYYPYGSTPYGHWLCYKWDRPYSGIWRIGPFVAQSFDPTGRYTWKLWFLSGHSWSMRSLSFNYVRGYYPPDIPGIAPAPVYNPASISSFSASKSAIEAGETVMLTWTTSNAASVNISPGVGTVAASGSTTVTPATTTTYTLTTSGQSGNSVSSTATVTVRPRVSPTISISEPTIKSGQSTYLSWNAPGAMSIFISGIGNVGGSGSQQISPRETTTYTLTATYVDGTSQSTSATLNVEQVPYLLWGIIALLAIAVIVIVAVLLARRPARTRRVAETQARHATATEDTDTADTELGTTPVDDVGAAKLTLPGGNDILLAGNNRSFGRRDFEDFMSASQVSYISRQHINIWAENGEYYIEDRSSTNGTRVNGTAIKGTGRHVLADGDVIELAGKLSFNFQKQNINN
jgi:flagellar basal body-associated protein FliL